MSKYRRKNNLGLFKLNWLNANDIIAVREETKKQVAKATHWLSEQGMHLTEWGRIWPLSIKLLAGQLAWVPRTEFISHNIFSLTSAGHQV